MRYHFDTVFKFTDVYRFVFDSSWLEYVIRVESITLFDDCFGEQFLKILSLEISKQLFVLALRVFNSIKGARILHLLV